jgi:hypothetical protein
MWVTAALVVALLVPQAKKPAPPKDESTFVKVAEDARLPQLAFDSEGNAYVTFVRKGNIELAISTDGGKSFGAPMIVLNSGGKDVGITNRGPRVSLDKNKRIWVSGPVCLAPPNAPLVNDLYYAVSSDRGKTFSKPFMINDGAGSATQSVHGAAAGPGELHVAWIDNKKSLLYCKFDAQGKRVGRIVPITGFACEDCPPGLAVDPAGNPSVAWRETPKDPKANRQIFLSRSTDAGKSFATTTQLNTLDSGLSECPQEPPAAAYSADGKIFAVAWMDRRDVERDADIYWSYGPPGKLKQDTDCHDDRRYQQRRPTLAIDSEGTVWCAWEDSRQTTLRVFFTNSKIEPNIPLGDPKEGMTSLPSLAAGGGRVAIAYQSGKDIGFRVLAVK